MDSPAVGLYSHALAEQERLKDYYIPKITSIQYEGNFVEPPRAVPWYPDQLAWSMTTPKNVIRRFAPFAEFQKFLVAETEVGNISRQEVVSMIPPLLLDVHPGMVVLDMCAAPGSKTAQMSEMVHFGEEEVMRRVSHYLENGGEEARRNGTVNVRQLLGEDYKLDGLSDDGRSTGLLVANDSDYKRAHMLIHQMKRLNSPNLLVTNHDATMYPSIRLPPITGADGRALKNRYLKFDRILADVPCSGDGTPRKNANVWSDWSPAVGMGLHPTQCRILARALQMLKVGGRVVYSTCSMNPVENEAVIASVVDRCGGPSKIEIIDCSDQLPELKRSQGLKDWIVMDKQGRLWNNFKDVEQEAAKGDVTIQKITESMFPPTEDDEEIELSRCMRVYPHQQDTGGFFITVLEKKGEIKTRPEGSKRIPKRSLDSVDDKPDEKPPTKKQKAAEDTPVEASLPRPTESMATPNTEAKSDIVQETEQQTVPKPEPDSTQTKTSEPTTSLPPKKRNNQPFEEPFKYLNSQNEELNVIFDNYGISPQFPRDRFMVRNAEGRPAKTIYYTSALGRDILVENEGSGIKFVHCGVKIFVKQDVQREGICPWRIQSEGLGMLEAWISKERVVKLYQKEPLRRLLIEMFPKMNDGGWKELGEIGQWAKDIDMGCHVLKVEPSDGEEGFRYVET